MPSSLPPSGWVLAILLAVYIFVGLIGHDPWKHDDAITIGVAYDIARNGNEGIGKPEPLKHGFQGYWSRRITDEHRLVYKIATRTSASRSPCAT